MSSIHRRTTMVPVDAATPLSSKEKACVSKLALESSFQLVEKSVVQGGAINWAKHATLGDIKLYAASDRFATTMFCGILEVGGVISDVIDFLRKNDHSETSAHDIDSPLKLLKSNPLFSISASRRVKAPVDVTWRSYQCPLGEPKRRDMCVLESRQGYVHVAKSIELASCPPLDSATYGVVRAVNHGSGTVVVEGERQGVLNVAYVSHIDFRADVHQQAMARKTMVATCVSELRRLENHLKLVRTLRNQRHPGLVVEIVPKAIRRYCHVCSSKFPSMCMISKKLCLHCGEVVCAPCLTNQFLKGPVEPTKFNLCVQCVSTLPPPMKQLLTSTANPPSDQAAPTTPSPAANLNTPTTNILLRSASKWWRRSSSTGETQSPHDSSSDELATSDSDGLASTDRLSMAGIESVLPSTPADGAEDTPSKKEGRFSKVWDLSPPTATLILLAALR